MRFLGVPINKIKDCNNHEDWYQEILVAFVIVVGVPVEEDLVDIIMSSIKSVVPVESVF